MYNAPSVSVPCRAWMVVPEADWGGSPRGHWSAGRYGSRLVGDLTKGLRWRWSWGGCGHSDLPILSPFAKMVVSIKRNSKPVALKSTHQRDSLGTPRDVTKFRFGSLNVGTMRGRGGEIAEMLSRRNVGICCVQETRWRGGSARMLVGKNSSYKMFWIGNDEGIGGVGILVAEKWVDRVFEVKRVNDRILVLKVVIGSMVVAVVSAYAPQVGLSEDVKDKFWSELLLTMSEIGEREIVVLGGDLNGHVGEHAVGFEGVHGGRGFGTRNAEGERILEFCDALQMVVCNTMFRKNVNRLVTFMSGMSVSQIDYFLVKKRDRKLVMDVKVIPGEECVTQHRLLVGDLLIRQRVVAKKKYLPRRKIWKLKEEGVRNSFCTEIMTSENAFNKEEGDLDKCWDVFKQGMTGAADRVCGWTKGPPRHEATWWWNDEVDRAIKEKRRLFGIWRSGGSKENYLAAKRRARKEVYKAKRREEEAMADRLERADAGGEVFRVARQILRANRDIVGEQCIRDDQGSVLVDSSEIRDAWREHHARISNVEFDWDRDSLEDVQPVLGPFPKIDEIMVKKAINRMKNGKAAGGSGIVAEMLKAAGDAGVRMMNSLTNSFVKEGRVPDDWLRSVLINIFKGKGDALVRGNYRGIKLQEQVMKAVECVMDSLLRGSVTVDSMQFGFMQGRGSTDAIFIVRQLQEQYLARGKRLYFVFVDLEKAFDRVPRIVVQWSLRKLGVNEWIVRAIMAMYKGSRAAVRVDGVNSEEFEVTVGVHQGSVLSPFLFILVLEALSRELRTGLPWEILYADDLVLVAESLDEAMDKFMLWKNGLESKGLKVNMDKTKVMISGKDMGLVERNGKWPCALCSKGVGSNSIKCCSCKEWVHKRCSGIRGRLQNIVGFKCAVCLGDRIIPERPDRVEVGGMSLECVNKFCYLGDVIGAGGGAEASAVARVRSGWRKFRELLPLLTSRGSLRLKGKLYATCVRSVMLYGTETWAMKEEDLQRFVRTENCMIRWMCKLARRRGSSLTVLRNQLEIESIDVIIRRGRLRWFGHVERSGEEGWLRRCMDLEVGGRRSRGRPRKTWWDSVRADLRAGGLRREDARDRHAWRVAIRQHPANPC